MLKQSPVWGIRSQLLEVGICRDLDISRHDSNPWRRWQVRCWLETLLMEECLVRHQDATR